MDMTWQHPTWLIAIVFAIGFALILRSSAKVDSPWKKVVTPSLWQAVGITSKHTRDHKWLAFLLCWLLAIFALASPSLEKKIPLFKNTHATVIVLDTSQYMLSTDVKPTRLTRARIKIRDLLKSQIDGEIALVAYAGSAHTVTPLTEDKQTIEHLLNVLTPDVMPKAGSDLNSGLNLAASLLRQAHRPGQVLVITGERPNAKAYETAKSLVDEDIFVNVFAIGKREASPIKATAGYLKDARGNIIMSEFNRDSLKQLAKTGNGIYTELTINDRDIENLAPIFNDQSSDELSNETKQLLRFENQGYWFLLLLLPLSLFFLKRGGYLVLLVVLLPAPFKTAEASIWKTQDQLAQEAFDNKKYQESALKFTDKKWQATSHYRAGKYQEAIKGYQHFDDATSLYNLGNSYAKAKQYQKAISAYQKSLEKDPTNEDAKANLKAVKDWLENKKQDQNKNHENNNNQQEKNKQNQQQGDDQEQDKSQESQDNADKNNQKDRNQHSQNDKQSQADDHHKPENLDTNDTKDSAAKAQSPQEDADKKGSHEANLSESEASDKEDPELKKWLRKIPDDPGGLLKRKFLLEQLKRERQGQ